MLCCTRRKNSRHVITQRIAGSASGGFLTDQPTLFTQQQYVLANQPQNSPYGTIGVVQQQLQHQQLQQQQLQLQLQQQQLQQHQIQQQQLKQQQLQQNVALQPNPPNLQTSTTNIGPPTLPTKSVHFLNTNINNNQPIYSNTCNSPANNGIYGQIRVNPLVNSMSNQIVNRLVPDMVMQSDFRKVSGITNDVYRQIEAVEKQFDQLNVNLEAVEKRGEMLIRVLDPRTLGRAGAEAGSKYLQQTAGRNLQQSVQFIEIIKRPGQTLGLYIRNRDNLTNGDGIFISKIEPESPLFNSGLLHIGDEILAVNLVDVAGMSVDDVVIIMSIPRRLVLTIRTNNLSRIASNQINQQICRALNTGNYAQLQQLQQLQQYQLQHQQLQQTQPPIVVLKKDIRKDDDLLLDDDAESNENLLGNVASLVGGNVIVSGDEIVVNGNMVVYEDPYGRIGLRPRDETNWTSRNNFIPGKPMLAVTQQPSNLRNIRTLDGIYGTIDNNYVTRPASRLLPSNKLQTRASIHRPPTALSNPNNSLRRPVSRLLRTESDNRILSGLNPTMSDYFLEKLSRPTSRLAAHNSALNINAGRIYGHLNRRRIPEVNHSLSTQGLSSILKRRSMLGSALLAPGPRSRSRILMTDNEGCLENMNSLHLPARPASALGTAGYQGYRSFYQQSLPPSTRYMLESGRASAMSFRSSSLPRQRLFGFSEDLEHKIKRPGSQVRFEKQNIFYNSYDEDSDLDDLNSKSILGRKDVDFQKWLNKAPAKSALYSTARKRSSTLPHHTDPSKNSSSAAAAAVAAVAAAAVGNTLQPSSLNKIAHSAESLLDTIKNEQQKSLIKNGIYSKRKAPELPPRSKPGMATLISDIKEDNLETKTDYLNLKNKSSSLFYKKSLPMTNNLALNESFNVSNQLLNNNSLSSEKNISSQFQSQINQIDSLRTIPNPTPIKPTDDERMHLLTLNPREFLKYKYDENSNDKIGSSYRNTDNNTYTGIISMHILAGRGLRSQSNQTNYRDLYCVIECDKIHKARTVVRSGESSFDWDEKFDLDLFGMKEISVLLYSWDPEYKHKLCYKGIINLISLNLDNNTSHSLALKMDPKGTVYLKMVFYNLRLSFARTKLSNKLFGGELEKTVSKEKQGSNIPLIVKKCVEEIEHRGMGLIGIYRICGSQVRKNLLKDAFEKNSQSVELGVDHVPDINVITSINNDKIIRQARLHRSAAIFSEAKYKWNGILPVKRYKNPRFSTKVFLGGVPWDIGEKGLISSFSLFGNIKTQWPGKEVKCTANGSPQRAGYVYVIFENEKQVKSLLQSCNYDFRNGVDKWYFNISSKRMRYKEVEVVPWIVENSTYVKNSSQRLDPKKTVFVGALHGMITAPALAKIMNEIFDNVIYVNIDVDKYLYPLGCAKITFSCPESYKKAVSAGFLEIKTNKFKKKIQMDPFLENSICSLCQLQLGPIFCRDLVCFRYFCSNCFNWVHSADKFKSHCPIMRSKRLLKDYLRELPDPLFTKALFEMMVDGLTVCLPDDRAGNAKLMFSILECLPKSDRCTVLFLMDHLKAIIKNSDRNKMTSQSLAVIFGPIFTCTSEDSSILHQTVQVFKFLLDIWPNKKDEIAISDPLETKKNYNFSNLMSPTSNIKSSINENPLNNSYDNFSYLNKTNDKLNLDSKFSTNDKRKLSTDLFSEKNPYSSDKTDNENKLDKNFKYVDSILKKPSDNLDYKSIGLSSNSHSSSNLNSLSGYQKPFSYHLPNHELNYNSTTTNKFSTTYSSSLKNTDTNNFKTNKILSSSYLNRIDDNDNDLFSSTKSENKRNLPSSEGLLSYQSNSYSQSSNRFDSLMKNKLTDSTTTSHDYLSNFSDEKLKLDTKISSIRSTKSSLIGDLSKNLDDKNYD